MKRPMIFLSIVIVLSMILGACVTATPVPTAAPTEAPTEAPTAAPTEAPTEAPTAAPTEAPVVEVKAGDTVLPRNETLYFNGQQWGSVVGWNPYSSSNNNAMALAAQDN